MSRKPDWFINTAFLHVPHYLSTLPICLNWGGFHYKKETKFNEDRCLPMQPFFFFCFGQISAKIKACNLFTEESKCLSLNSIYWHHQKGMVNITSFSYLVVHSQSVPRPTVTAEKTRSGSRTLRGRNNPFATEGSNQRARHVMFNQGKLVSGLAVSVDAMAVNNRKWLWCVLYVQLSWYRYTDHFTVVINNDKLLQSLALFVIVFQPFPRFLECTANPVGGLRENLQGDEKLEQLLRKYVQKLKCWHVKEKLLYDVKKCYQHAHCNCTTTWCNRNPVTRQTLWWYRAAVV